MIIKTGREATTVSEDVKFIHPRDQRNSNLIQGHSA